MGARARFCSIRQPLGAFHCGFNSLTNFPAFVSVAQRTLFFRGTRAPPRATRFVMRGIIQSAPAYVTACETLYMAVLTRHLNRLSNCRLAILSRRPSPGSRSNSVAAFAGQGSDCQNCDSPALFPHSRGAYRRSSEIPGRRDLKGGARARRAGNGRAKRKHERNHGAS